jgi:hypothetical protein
MKAKFYAFNTEGNQRNPSTSAINITENGLPRSVTTVTSSSSQPAQALSSVLVIDVSESMVGDHLDLAKEAATTWVNHLTLGQSECAITCFDGNNYVLQDFTTGRGKLITAINDLQSLGYGCSYDKGLYYLPAGGLQVSKNGKHKRVIVFLTDGSGRSLRKNDIIAEAKKQHCQIFVVTIGIACPQSLKDISTQTGGDWYEKAGSASNPSVANIYKEILYRAQTDLPPCEITWESAVSCIQHDVNTLFTCDTFDSKLLYMIPLNAIAKLECNPVSLYLRSKPINQKFDTAILVTALNSPFTVSNISSTNAAFDINPKSFSLSVGQTRTLTISYIPPDSNYSWTQFDFQTDICPQVYYATGTYPKVKPKQNSLKLNEPNGSESLMAGLDTIITWSGIPLTDTVKIEFSSDGGSDWTIITDNATGGQYRWHIPSISSNSCLLKVTQLSQQIFDGWVISLGGPGNDTGMCMAIDNKKNVYVAGSFEGIATFGKQTLTASANKNMFLAKFFPDGELDWISEFKGSKMVYARSIAIDSSGNCFVTGSFTDTIIFPPNTKLASAGVEDVFLAKYRSDGTLDWALSEGGTNQDIGERVACTKEGDCYVSGYMQYTALFGSISLTTKFGGIFLAKYHSDGTIAWALTDTGTGTYSEGAGLVIDSSGDIILSGAFTVNCVLNGVSLSNGINKLSGYIAKFHPDASVQWALTTGGENAYITDLGIDSHNNLYTCGGFAISAEFNLDTLIGNNYYYDQFISRYNPQGICDWGLKIDFDTVSFMAVDRSGNAYVSNSLDTSSILKSHITKYSSDKQVQWIKTPVGFIRFLDITASNNDEVYATGIYKLNAYFDGDSIKSEGANDIFIWKLGRNSFQSDTSDASFSILMPQIISHNIDMGKVLVQNDKDSIIQTFISNIGTSPIRVDAIDITGPNKLDFNVVSGIPPFEIAPGSVQNIEFNFNPSSTGVKDATVSVITQASSISQSLSGEGIVPTIKLTSDLIDFGQIAIGSFKDTTITVAIQNNGTVAVDFNSASQLGPDKTQFSVQSGGSAFTLAPGASQTVTLRFAPKFIGRTSGRIGFDYNGPGSPAVLNLFGQGLGGLVRMLDDSAYSGQHRDVPLILEKVPVSSVQSVATNFKARVLYDKTVLYPTDNTIEQGVRYDTVTLTGSLGIDEVIARIPFIAMLGMSQISPMSIVDFQWLDASGNPADFDVETESGTFKVLDICDQGGKRLYDPDGKVVMSSIVPNPTSNSAHIEIQTIEKGRTELTVTNLLGQTVATLFDGEIEPGIHDFQLSTTNLSAGSYFLTLRTPTVRKIQRLDIAK